MTETGPGIGIKPMRMVLLHFMAVVNGGLYLLLYTQGQGARESTEMYCNISWFTPTGGASGLNTSTTTKIVPVLVLLWTNFCGQVI